MSFKPYILFFLILVFIIMMDFFYLGRPVVGIDDANISMNYAWHLSKGEGFVFNHGGEKVEGFTSLLWVLIIRLFYDISSYPELMLLGFLLLLTTCTVSLVYREVSRDIEQINPILQRKYFIWIFSGFLLCIGPSYVVWSVLSLMENGLWNFLFAVIVVILLQMLRGNYSVTRKVILLIAAILLLLTRPEAMFWSAMFAVFLGLIAIKNKSGFIFPLIFFVCMAGTITALVFFRVHYFGYPLPNTYYAKVSGDEWYNLKEGTLYLLKFITSYHPLITFLLVVLFIATITTCLQALKKIHRDTKVFGFDWLESRSSMITLVIFFSLVLPMTTGGDHFGGFRFYQGSFLFFIWGVPALLFLVTDKMGVQSGKLIQHAGLSLVMTFIIFSAGSFYKLKNLFETRLNFEFSLASDGRKAGEFLNHFWNAEKPSVGLIAVGGFSLKYQGETVDLMGLNNTIMGHSKGDRKGIKNHAAFNKEVFYQLHPDLLLPKIVGSETGARMYYDELMNESDFVNQAMKNIFNDSIFINRYDAVMLKRKDKTIFAFINRDVIFKLEKDSTLELTKLRL